MESNIKCIDCTRYIGTESKESYMIRPVGKGRRKAKRQRTITTYKCEATNTPWPKTQVWGLCPSAKRVQVSKPEAKAQ